MQADSQTSSDFYDRTERLAEVLRVTQEELAERIGVSRAMHFGYRSGKYPVSRKVWRKLEESETQAGIRPRPDELRSAESPAKFGSREALHGHASPAGGTHSPVGRGVIAPHDQFSPHALSTTEADVHAYLALVLSAAAGDPRRLAVLLETLQLHLDPWLRKWRAEG